MNRALRFNLETLLSALILVFGLYLLAPASALACGAGIADTTTYFLPHVDNYCRGGEVCSAFRREVRMQGSGRLRTPHVYRYTGRRSSMPDCDTTTGAAGRCLIPYISVAADPRFYRMGTIIEMPALKGKWMTLPDGQGFRHPGYLRVDDTGGAIKGKGRFDLFTGFYNPRHSNNTFGYNGDFMMSAKHVCPNYKKYSTFNSGYDFDEANRAINRIDIERGSRFELLTSARPVSRPNRTQAIQSRQVSRPQPRPQVEVARPLPHPQRASR